MTKTKKVYVTQKISECRYYKGLIDTNRNQRLETTAPPSPPKRVKKSRKPYFRDFFIFTKPDLKQKCNKSCKGTPFYSEIRSHICTPILCRLFLVMNASRLPSLLPSGIINDLKPMCKPPCPSPHQRYVLHPIGIPLTEKY